jgi:maltooligosyltrehalose trehalohydrolase
MKPSLGAAYLSDGRCRFQVWAPSAEAVDLRLVSPQQRVVRLEKAARGYHQAVLSDIDSAACYLYRLQVEPAPGTAQNPLERPDPASRYQPQGVHGPSQVFSSAFDWQDANWFGLPLSQYIIYELRVGTFTAEGTFDAVIQHLDRLIETGITAVELMPVAQFPGSRNWGYDGTYPFAAQNTYGGPLGLQRLVNACHRKGLAVVLDVVYNHLGPEGNYLRDFGPYFTDFYQTPWGEAVNFDGPHSDEVRRFFIENALYWVRDCHIDAIRIDAVHAILDFTARPFLEQDGLEVRREAERLNRQIYCIAESALNDTRVVRRRELGGFGLDAQWNDDFHHALHSLLTGERSGYYQDFGRLHDLSMSWREGFVYSGQYSAYRRRRHGNSSRAIPARQFVCLHRTMTRSATACAVNDWQSWSHSSNSNWQPGWCCCRRLFRCFLWAKNTVRLRRFHILSATVIRIWLPLCARVAAGNFQPSAGRRIRRTPRMRPLSCRRN